MRRVADFLRRGWLLAKSERGSNVVELSILAPALMMLCMLIVQFALWFSARQAALASAQAGAQVARQEAALTSTWSVDAQRAASSYYRALKTHLVSRLTTSTSGDPRTNVYVTVRGPLGYSVFPFFGLHLWVSATAGGPVECFRPAGQGGAC